MLEEGLFLSEPYPRSIIRTAYKLYAGRFEGVFQGQESGNSTEWDAVGCFDSHYGPEANPRLLGELPS